MAWEAEVQGAFKVLSNIELGSQPQSPDDHLFPINVTNAQDTRMFWFMCMYEWLSYVVLVVERMVQRLHPGPGFHYYCICIVAKSLKCSVPITFGCCSYRRNIVIISLKDSIRLRLVLFPQLWRGGEMSSVWLALGSQNSSIKLDFSWWWFCPLGKKRKEKNREKVKLYYVFCGMWWHRWTEW